MKSRDLMVPALVFLGGAIIGRVIGVKPILKGAMTAANFAGYGPGDLFKSAARKTSRKVTRKVNDTVRKTRRAVSKIEKAPVRRAAASSKKPIQKKSKVA
jgi:hypothetical protein